MGTLVELVYSVFAGQSATVTESQFRSESEYFADSGSTHQRHVAVTQKNVGDRKPRDFLQQDPGLQGFSP